VGLDPLVDERALPGAGTRSGGVHRDAARADDRLADRGLAASTSRERGEPADSVARTIE